MNAIPDSNDAIYKSNECYKYIDDVYNIMCGRTIL